MCAFNKYKFLVYNIPHQWKKKFWFCQLKAQITRQKMYMRKGYNNIGTCNSTDMEDFLSSWLEIRIWLKNFVRFFSSQMCTINHFTLEFILEYANIFMLHDQDLTKW